MHIYLLICAKRNTERINQKLKRPGLPVVGVGGKRVERREYRKGVVGVRRIGSFSDHTICTVLTPKARGMLHTS